MISGKLVRIWKDTLLAYLKVLLDWNTKLQKDLSPAGRQPVWDVTRQATSRIEAHSDISNNLHRYIWSVSKIFALNFVWENKSTVFLLETWQCCGQETFFVHFWYRGTW
jgi:hypothetical protein